MTNIGILYICTGEYSKFWDTFYESCESLFCIGDKKTYFIFTDNEYLLNLKQDNLKIIYLKNEKWPFITLNRYKTFVENKDIFNNIDYLIFFNSNLIIKKEVNINELFNSKELFATLHPGFFNKNTTEYTYEKNKQSLAYIEPNDNSIYVCGGFNGGKKDSFLSMSESIDNNTKIDMSRNIIAVWHDESHFNKYVSEHINNFNIVKPEYCYPQNWDLPFSNKIEVRDKKYFISLKHKTNFLSRFKNYISYFRKLKW